VDWSRLEVQVEGLAEVEVTKDLLVSVDGVDLNGARADGPGWEVPVVSDEVKVQSVTTHKSVLDLMDV